MNANLSYLKGHLAKWLLNVTLIFSLLAISAPVSLSQRQIQVTPIALVHVRHSSTIKTVDYHETFLPLFASNDQTTKYLYFILFYNRLAKIEFDALSNNFATIRCAVQRPCIAFIFHHSDQNSVIV